MCGRFSLHSPAQIIAELFQIQWDDVAFEPRYNLAPTQVCPVVFNDVSGKRTVEIMRWGLIPSWSKDEKLGAKMINARYETAAEKPSFRRALKKRRCVVPANGFFEWKKNGNEKQPYFIHRPDSELLAMAGLWEQWQGVGGNITSFTILTRPAQGKVTELHHRMPVCVPLKDLDPWLSCNIGFEGDWFDNPPQFIFHPVSKAVNSVKNDTRDCIVIEAGPEQSLPF